MQTRQIRNHPRLSTWLGVILVTMGLGLFQFSCYYVDEITASDTDVVITFYEPAADFSGKIYAMPDTADQGLCG
jgi:hypothetical protein